MDTNAAIKFIADNPRSTAKEAGLTNAEVNALVGAGKLIQAGKRKTGKKGKPPYEYVVPSYDLSNDPETSKAADEAKARVAEHRRYERFWTKIMMADRQYGYGSEQHTAAKLDMWEVFPKGVIPVTPSSNDYVLAGVITDADLALLTDEDENV